MIGMNPVKVLFTLACLLGFATALQAQQTCKTTSVPETTPTTEFTDNQNGTVTHNRTGLMWKRCAEGQTWSGGTCTGTASPYTWSGALVAGRTANFASYTDWRLPNVKELESIVEGRCFTPSINASIFPNTGGATDFWSASPAGLSQFAWYINFGFGIPMNDSVATGFQVRLVRAGQSSGAFDVSKDTVPLRVSKAGTGSVTGGPINCGSTCTANVLLGTVVTLTAAPEVQWGGDCALQGSSPTCTLAMTTAKTVSATFADGPFVVASPDSLSFEPRNIASKSPLLTVTLYNLGGGALRIDSISANGDFSVLALNTANDCGSSLALGSNCSIGVRFTPTAAGARTGTVNLVSSAADSPQSLVALSGTGISVAPVCTLAPMPSKVRSGKATVLTASCSPAASSYTWTGGQCATRNTGATCTDTPALTTVYGVTGTNAYGSSNATTTVTVSTKNADLTPILMLLLD